MDPIDAIMAAGLDGVGVGPYQRCVSDALYHIELETDQ